jgi:hypothetical protein
VAVVQDPVERWIWRLGFRSRIVSRADCFVLLVAASIEVPSPQVNTAVTKSQHCAPPLASSIHLTAQTVSVGRNLGFFLIAVYVFQAVRFLQISPQNSAIYLLFPLPELCVQPIIMLQLIQIFSCSCLHSPNSSVSSLPRVFKFSSHIKEPGSEPRPNDCCTCSCLSPLFTAAVRCKPCGMISVRDARFVVPCSLYSVSCKHT